MLGHPVAGPSWEGFAIENLIESAGPDRTPYYFRTEDGAEIDLVFERGGVVEMAIEIKRSTAPVLSRGFRVAADALHAKARFLVHGGDATWTADGVQMVPLDVLMRQLAGTTPARVARSKRDDAGITRRRTRVSRPRAK